MGAGQSVPGCVMGGEGAASEPQRFQSWIIKKTTSLHLTASPGGLPMMACGEPVLSGCPTPTLETGSKVYGHFPMMPLQPPAALLYLLWTDFSCPGGPGTCVPPDTLAVGERSGREERGSRGGLSWEPGNGRARARAGALQMQSFLRHPER